MLGGAQEIIPVIVLLQTCWSQAEVFTSVARVMSLVSLESKVVDHLERVLSVSRQNGESGKLLADMHKHVSCMRQRNSIVKTSPTMLQNPVVGFQFLRRLVGEWNRVNRTVRKDTSSNSRNLIDNMLATIDVLNKWQHWPKQTDMTGAAIGLLTVGQVYDLFPSPAWLDDGLTSTSYSKQTVESKCMMLTHDRVQSMLVTLHRQRLFINSILNISKEKIIPTRIDRTCDYNYWALSSGDYLFIIQVALKYKMYTEVKRWSTFVESFIEINPHPSHRILAQLETIKKVLATSRISSVRFDQKTPEDSIQTAYVRLCRQSIQWNQGTTVSLGRWLYCFWSTTHGYLRHKAEIIHSSPLVIRFYDVISQTEIDHVIDEALAKLMPSDLHANHRTTNRTHLLRVSQTAWLADYTHVLRILSARVGQVTGLDTRQLPLDTPAEPFQVVNYGLGGQYVPHEDSVRRAREMGQEKNPSLRGSGDRLATWMFYLSDVEAGGATVFPRLNVYVRPIKGSAILWYNLKRNGDVDKKLIHASCPVLLGEKWGRICGEGVTNAIRNLAYPVRNPAAGDLEAYRLALVSQKFSKKFPKICFWRTNGSGRRARCFTVVVLRTRENEVQRVKIS